MHANLETFVRFVTSLMQYEYEANNVDGYMTKAILDRIDAPVSVVMERG